MDHVLKRVREFVDGHALIEQGDTVVCAVSGGVDSMAMLDILWRLSREKGFDLHVAHFDHRLRGGEGALEADLVRGASGERGLPFSSGSGDVRGYMERHAAGLEEAARILRYRYLFDVMQRTGGRRLATAHHADDQVETVFLRLLRGTGLKGLAGIRPIDVRGVIRPLLCLRKRELVDYARAQRLPYREDRTNREPVGPRNELRNHLLVVLGEPDRERLAESVSNLTASIAGLNAALDSSIEGAFSAVSETTPSSETKLDLKKLKSYHYIVRKGVYRFAYHASTGRKRELARKATERLVRFCEKDRNGSEIHLPGNVRVFQEYGHAVFVRHGDSGRPSAVLTFPEDIDHGREYFFGAGHRRVRLKLEKFRDVDSAVMLARSEGRDRAAVFDYEQLTPPLSLRGWIQGDRFEPFGLGGTKNVSDLLQEERVPRRRRKSVTLLVDGERILWVVGVRRSAHAPVGPGTRQVMSVRLENDSERSEPL